MIKILRNSAVAAAVVMAVGFAGCGQVEPIYPSVYNAEQSKCDTRTREYLSPVKIVWTQNAELISNVDYLLREGNGQADLTNSHICVMKSTAKEHPAVLLDFGKELQGGLQIVTGMPASHDPVRIRVKKTNLEQKLLDYELIESGLEERIYDRIDYEHGRGTSFIKGEDGSFDNVTVGINKAARKEKVRKAIQESKRKAKKAAGKKQASKK